MAVSGAAIASRAQQTFLQVAPAIENPPQCRHAPDGGHWGADRCHHSVSLNPRFWDIQPRQVVWRPWRSRNSDDIASHVARTFL